MVPQFIYFLTLSRVLQIFSRQTSAKEVSLPPLQENSLSQRRSYICRSLLYYNERIGLIPSPLFSSWRGGQRSLSFLHIHPPFIMSFASHIPDRKILIRTSVPGVGILFWPNFLWSSATSSLKTSSFYWVLEVFIIHHD